MVKLRRRALLCTGAAAGLVAGAGLAGCASIEEDVQRLPAQPPGGVLRPWLSLTGGWRLESTTPTQPLRPGGVRTNFVRPVGVAARNQVLLVADAGARQIWRVDRLRDALSAFVPFTGFVPDHGTSMQMGNDLAAWVALPSEHMVVQYDYRGQAVRRWRDDREAPRPVAVAVPEDRTQVLVADAATARVLVFDPLGNPRHVLGGTRPPDLQSIAAMALGPKGLYVLDRIAQQVVVLDPRGVPVEVIGEHQMVQPRALAVDGSGRVFVSDDQEQRIKVFRGDRLLASFGGFGNGPSQFGRIESMALDGNMLYVADSLNSRVQVLLVAPPSFDEPEPPR